MDLSATLEPASAPPATGTRRKPALKLTGTQRPAIAIPQRHTAPVPLAPPPEAAERTPAPARRLSPWPSAEALTEWVDAGDEYSLRFLHTAGESRGKVGDGEWEYFRTDFASLMDQAALIGETLGFSPPSLAAIVEPDRAACYRRLAGGFAGTYSGPGSSVENLIAIP